MQTGGSAAFRRPIGRLKAVTLAAFGCSTLPARELAGFSSDELQAIAPRIFRVETPCAREVVIVDYYDSPANESFAQRFQIRRCKCRMRLPGRPKIPLYADVQLLGTAFKPATTSRTQRLRFRQLTHSQDRPVKRPGGLLTPFRRRNLNVVDRIYEG